MSDETPKLYVHKPKKAQLKKHLQQQSRSSPSPSPSPSPAPVSSMTSQSTTSSSSSRVPPPTPPKESFARRYRFLWPLLLAVNFSVGGCIKSFYTSQAFLVTLIVAMLPVLSIPVSCCKIAGNKLLVLKAGYTTSYSYEQPSIYVGNEYVSRIAGALSAAYLFMRTKKKENIEENVTAVTSTPTPAVSTAAVTDLITSHPVVVEPAKVREPIPVDQQRELFKWILEEKRKTKPKNAEEKKKIDEEKAILKQFIRAKSIPPL